MHNRLKKVVYSGKYFCADYKLNYGIEVLRNLRISPDYDSVVLTSTDVYDS